MIQQVIYELGLRDKFSSQLSTATGAVNKFESALGGVVAKAAAAFASFEFLKGSVEMFNEAQQASAQLNATLRSTGNIAMLNREALDKQADALMHKSLFDDDEITRAQSILATFTNIRGEVYMQTIPAITDLATKMGTDLKSATIQVGKAMQDLTGGGLRMLKKSGVDFSDTQIKIIKNLFATGEVAKAQTMILAELRKEFDGSALAASRAGTGPFTVLQHEFANVREEIGGLLVQLGLKLMPYLKEFVEWTKRAVDWVKQHTKVIKDFAVAIGVAWAAFKVLGGASAILSTLGISLTALTGPIGVVAIAIGGLTLAWSQLSVSIDDAKKKQDEFYEPAYTHEKQMVTGWLTEGNPSQAAQKNILENEANRLKKDIASQQEILKKIPGYKIGDRNVIDYVNEGEIIDDLKELFTGDNKSAATGTAIVISNLKSRLKAVEELQAEPMPTGTQKYDIPLGKVKNEPTKATGAKSVTINVDINELIGIKEFNTTNIREGVNRVKEAVIGVMTDAVNDFQIVASAN